MNNESGQSLVEVIAALTVVAIIVFVLVKASTTSIRNATFARNWTLATKYAQELIEEARKLRDNQPEKFFSDINFCNKNESVGIFTSTRICSLSSSNTMNVVVLVSWEDSLGVHESKLETILTSWK